MTCVPCAARQPPELVDLHRQYQDAVFLGLTYAVRAPAERFVREAGIDWPVGFGAGKTIAALVGPAPTIFVVGADGRIVWHDDRSRFRHDTADFRADLEAALDRALGQAQP